MASTAAAPVAAYPLSWPETMPRAKHRVGSAFKTTLAGALENVQTSLRLFGRDSGKPVQGVVISSNVTLGASKPEDPGVAVWMTWEGVQVCIPVDKYASVEANLQAIHHIIEARRVELRHGTLALVRATFHGFKALPPPPNRKPWTEVLGLPRITTRAAVDEAFRLAALKAHPDSGGTRERWEELQAAKASALLDLGAD